MYVMFSSCLIPRYNNHYDVLFYNVHNHINILVTHIVIAYIFLWNVHVIIHCHYQDVSLKGDVL